MTTTPRPRFSVRTGRAEPQFDGPYQGMPPHLEGPLQQWVGTALALQAHNLGHRQYDEATAQILCVRLRIPVYGRRSYAQTLMDCVGDALLDVVDALLAYWREIGEDGWSDSLEQLFNDAGSAYRVAETGDGLEERVTPAVRDAVMQTITEAAGEQSAGSAAAHLAAAWQAAYGRGPDPVRAYSESIKAVESAAHSVIQPNKPKATLGTMLGEIKNARHKFGFAIPVPAAGDPVAVAEAMMRVLWEGQTSRHGGQTATPSETLESARAGVHLAATLVQWFVSGAVIRTP
ncbi:hypothetical protein [Streptomyces sp. NPDC048659]|uniref:hypothetical protein n=1 Tax=Streptomyces sp. NPDC048659 TaxID=3155489 RepID=UPI0034303898